ncbi:MAG: signal transduction histidine kinase [Candidatus Paceibacteria bacterium]|jgi:signal transduction histidine kinase
MQLRSKIIASLSFVMGLYVISDYFIVQSTFVRSINEFEQAQAQATTVGVKQALEQELRVLDGRALDWAQADGSAEFLQGTRPSYRDMRLGPNVLGTESLDLLYLCDNAGRVLWGKYRHPDVVPGAQSEDALELRPEGELLSDGFRTGWRAEDRARGITRAQKGFLDTELGPLMLATQPVGGSSTGGACGFVVLGRFISQERIEAVEGRTHATNLRVWFHDESQAPADESAYVSQFNGEPLIKLQDEDVLQVYHMIQSPLGEGAGEGGASWLVLRADVSREISKIGAAGARSALISTLAAGLILMYVLVGLLQRTVLKPIGALMTNAVRVGEDDTADVRFDLDREDEVGVLSREFDNMMEKLAASRAALVDTAREAGKSEIATGILHNVGNVLNSVNVSTSMLTKQADELATQDLEALNDIIAEHAADLAGFMASDPRGKHFQPFLSALTTKLTRGKAGLSQELEALNFGIGRIRDLVNSQQDYVTRAEVIENCDLGALVERAFEVSENVDAVHRGIEFKREFGDVPKIPLDRYKTLEILVNLIQNARQAMAEGGEHSMCLSARLLAPTPDMVRLEIEDNGIGISPDHLSRVFDHGFSTKPRGHGFGLHSAANAATEMHGSLTVRSPGPGQGATFILELPTRVSQLSSLKS